MDQKISSLLNIRDGSNMDPKRREEVIEIIEKLLIPLSEKFNVSEELLETLYAMAHKLYELENYEKSAKIFHGLCVLDHLDHRFWKGLGASRQMGGNLSGAVEAYSVAMATGVYDADTFLHVAECLIALGRFNSARDALKWALQLIQKEPEKWESIKKRTEALSESLQRKVRKKSKQQ